MNNYYYYLMIKPTILATGSLSIYGEKTYVTLSLYFYIIIITFKSFEIKEFLQRSIILEFDMVCTQSD